MQTKTKYRLVIYLSILLLLVTVILPATGCDKPTADEIVSNVLDSYSQVETYSAGETMESKTVIIGGDRPGTSYKSENSTANFSIVNRQYSLVSTRNGQPMQGMTTYSLLYLVDEMLYIKGDILDYEDPEHENIWVKLDLGQEDLNHNDKLWNDHNPLGQQIDLLKTVEQVTLLQSEKVNGKDTYVLDVQPNWMIFADWLGQQPPWQGPDWYDLPDLLKTLSLRLWIDKSTYHIVKLEIDAEYALTYFTSPESTISLRGTILFERYNEPVTVTLPEEAKDAIRGPIS